MSSLLQSTIPFLFEEISQWITAVFAEKNVEFPLLRFKEPEVFPGLFPLLLVAPYRGDLARFFQEILTHGLFPGRTLPLENLFYTKYAAYLVFYVNIALKTEKEFEAVLSHFPVLEKEIVLGSRSIYHAKRLLESKGMINEEKSLLIQEKITTLLHRYGRFFDFDIYHWMQKFLLQTKEGYKRERSYRTLLKIIAIGYILLGALSRAVEKSKAKRHLFFKLLRIPLETPFGTKENVGFFIALNFLKENEVFERKRFLKIIQRAAPRTHVVTDSLLQENEGRRFLFYVELEKEGEELFSRKEMHFLKKILQEHLQDCIESLVRPLFMPRNEEEVMKYLVLLGGELHEENDLPQVVILFEEQSDRDLFFTVILARPRMEEVPTLEELFPKEIEKTRIIGHLPKKILKEAGVLRIRLSNLPFLRQDFAVDLYKARQRVVKYLSDIIGPIRDYNGGMIARQMEVLEHFKRIVGKSNEFIVENFFHSLHPAESRVVAKISDLKGLYQLFFEVFQGKGSYREKISAHSLAICVKLSDSRKSTRCLRAIQKMHIPTNQLIRLSLPIQESHYLGYLFFSDSPTQQEIFLETLRGHL